jgi:hypothetical protein
MFLCDLLSLSARLDGAEATCPRSKVILRWTWDAEPVRISEGCGDSWPITWGDDGALYAAYGDGEGFGKRSPHLSLGFAKVSGDPPALRAEDLATNIDTPEGGGSSGIQSLFR